LSRVQTEAPMNEQTPLRADARRNRAKVLEAAQEAFATDGLSVSLDEIARRAGVGAGTVYRHFPTKEALFEAVMHDRMQGLVDEARALVTASEPDAALFAFLERLIAESAMKKDLVDALSGAGVDLTTTVSDDAANLRRELGRLLKRAQQQGAVRGDVDINELMALLWGMMSATQRSQAKPISPRRASVVLCDGLRTRTDSK
jgi:AcrR family transcriptional regulator